MSGKPEGRTGPPGLQNVLVYVSGEGFYPSNGSSGTNYSAPPAVKQPPKIPQQPQQQSFYNIQQQQQQNGYQYSVASYNGPGVRSREDTFSTSGDGNVVFSRSSEAESSCSSLSSVGDQYDSVSVNIVPAFKTQFPLSDIPSSIAVPVGWKRLLTNGMVIYVSPSQTALSSLDQVRAYLQTQGTCKCGLQCPINCDIVFNFDPKLATRPWSPSSGPVGDLANLCNHKHHKRKQPSPMAVPDHHPLHLLDPKSRPTVSDAGKKKKRKVGGSYNASVSQLLAQRERERNKEVQSWSESGGREGSPMMMQMQQQQAGPMGRGVYSPGYNEGQLYRYPGGPGPYPPQSNCMMMSHQYQYQQRDGTTDYHCQQKPHPQQYQQQHFQQVAPHMMQSNPSRPQMPYGVQHPQMLNQHYDRMMAPSQFQYHQQDQKPMQMMQQQHQHSVAKPQLPSRDSYQRLEAQQQMHPGQQGIVAQPLQGQPMLPQQTLMQQQQQQSSGMQVSQSQTMIQSSPMMVPSQNMAMQQNHLNQVMLQQHTPQMQQGVQLQIPPNQHPVVLQNQQQNSNQIQNNSPSSSMCASPASIMHHQRPAPPWQTNRNNQLVNQSAVINQQQPPPHNQQQPPPHNQQQPPPHNQQQQQQPPPPHNLQPQPSPHNLQQPQPPSHNHHQPQPHNHQQPQPHSHQQPQPSSHSHQQPQSHNHQQPQLSSHNHQQPQPSSHNHQQPQPLIHHNQQQQALLQNQQVMQPSLYDRVPPLHHHLPSAPVWNEDRKKAISKMQGKPVAAAHMKNKRVSYVSEHHHHLVGTTNEQPCPNVDVRHIPQELNKPQNSQSHEFLSSSVPSFMDDPSGYLAQQTALLNSTISRQTGMNSNGVSIVCQNTCSNHANEQNNGQDHVVINIPSSTCSPVGNQGVPLPSNLMLANQQKHSFVSRLNNSNSNNGNNGIKVYRSSSVSSTGFQNQPQSQSQAGIPDSSGVSPDSRGKCPQGCSSNLDTFHQHSQNQNHNLAQNPVNVKFNSEDNPVTSSTFLDNRQQIQSKSCHDNRGPIQGGTVSTSNRSPAEIVMRIPPDEPSPGRTPTPSSTHSRRTDGSPESSLLISTSSPFTIANGNTIVYQQHDQQNSPNVRQESSVPQSPKPQQHQSQQQQSQPQQQQQHISMVLQDLHVSRIPTIVTTMASGHTVSSNTITSVLAGRANTATVTVNNQTTGPSPTAPPAVVSNQQMPQVAVSKSPLEMVQSVVSSIQVPASSADGIMKSATTSSLSAGHILMSSNGQLIVTNTHGQQAILSPQQNLTKINTSMPAMTGSSTIVTSVSGTMTQVIPTVGVTQQVLGQPTVLVNALPAPLLFQPGMMTVDGMNTVQIPHLAVATGNVLPGQMVDESRVGNNSSGAFSPRNQSALLSPEGSNGKRKGNVKKRKVSPQTVASMLHIAAQQNSPTAGATGMVVQQQQQPQQNFSSPMLQALTILPSKTNHFGGTQQLIATGNILQPLNLVQNFPTIQQFIVPAGLGGMVMATGDGTATLLQDTVQLNVLTPMQGPGGTVFGHTSGQSILTAGPAGMVIRTPTNSNQQTNKVLHSQNNNGNQFIASSPNQFLVNNPAFSGQLSPMLANVSPTNQQIHSFATSAASTQTRPNQDFIQCGQTLMVPCSISQNSQAQNTTVVQQNTTIVQQQTTMVSNNQQNIEQNPGPSTSTSSSLSLNQHNFILNNNDGKQQNFILTTDQKGQGGFILSPNPDKPGTHILLNADKTQYGGLIISQEKPNQMCGNFILSNSNIHQTEKSPNSFVLSANGVPDKQSVNRFAKHSVSTQTAANQQVLQVSTTPVPNALVVATSNTFCQTSTAASSYSGSPPDTTTHSPVEASNSQSPAPSSCIAVGSTVSDDLSSPTSSSDPAGRAQPMVHCVSSSNEPDTPDWKDTSSTSPAMFSPPPNNMDDRGIGSLKNMSRSSFVESSSTTVQNYECQRLLKHTNDGEAVGRPLYDYGRTHKRKHTDCDDTEPRIHTSTLSPQDEDDGVVN